MCRALLWFWIWAGLSLEFRAALVKFRFLFKSQILAEPQVRCSEEPHASVSHSEPQDIAEFKHQFLVAENTFFLIVLKRFLLDRAQPLQGLCRVSLETLGSQFGGCPAVFPSPNSCCEQWARWNSAKLWHNWNLDSFHCAFYRAQALHSWKYQHSVFIEPGKIAMSLLKYHGYLLLYTDYSFRKPFYPPDFPKCSNS